MVGNHITKRTWLRVLAISVAVLTILLAAQVVFHSHSKGQNEAACQVCQAAHLGAAQVTGNTSLCSPLVATRYVEPLVLSTHQEFFYHPRSTVRLSQNSLSEAGSFPVRLSPAGNAIAIFPGGHSNHKHRPPEGAEEKFEWFLESFYS
jgi:hypothetical protein